MVLPSQIATRLALMLHYASVVSVTWQAWIFVLYRLRAPLPGFGLAVLSSGGENRCCARLAR